MDETNVGLSALPDGWVWTTISSTIKKVSIGEKKLKQKNYEEVGKLPVIDQGQSFVGGYTNYEELKVECQLPVVVFGDHTKVFKYVDFEFVAGADGIKVIKPQEMYYPKLFYYFAQAIWLPDKGYARHFQFLEKAKIPLPPLSEQHRIVAKIEELFTKLDAGKEELLQAKARLKRYRQSVLKAAMEGKLTEDWRKKHGSEIEPASVLLNRILTERREKWEAEQLEQMSAKGKMPKGDKWKNKYKEPSEPDTSKLPELPKGWVWTAVGEIAQTIHYGYTESAVNDPVGPKFLRITDIQNNSVNWDSVPYCRINGDVQHKYLLEEGDLVFARTGATVGKSFLIRGSIPYAVFASYLIRIILHKETNANFVYTFFGQVQKVL